MQMLVTGIFRRFGTSKAGKPYDMTQLLALQAMGDNESASSKMEAHGYQPVELDAAQTLVQKIKMAQIRFPCVLDLEIGHEMRYGKIQSIVIDYKVVPTGKDL